MFKTKYLLTIDSPAELEKIFQEDPKIIWQKSSKNDKFYINQLVIDKKHLLLAVLKPTQNFMTEVAQNSTGGSNLIHLAAQHANSAAMWDALQDKLENALDRNPDLLNSIDIHGEKPLWIAVHNNNLFMTKYLLEKFAQHFSRFSAGPQDHSFRDMFYLFKDEQDKRISLFERAIAVQADEQLINLLKFYGADFYVPNLPRPKQAKDLPQYNEELFSAHVQGRVPAGQLYPKEVYWSNLLKQRLTEFVDLSFAGHGRFHALLKQLEKNPDIQVEEPSLPKNQEISPSLFFQLAAHLENELALLEGLHENYAKGWKVKSRQAVKKAAHFDLADHLTSTGKKIVEKGFFALCFVGYVFWCRFNHEIFNQRAEVRNSLYEEYGSCTQVEYFNKTVPRSHMQTCLKAPSTFPNRCIENKEFMDAYAECYDLGLIAFFQTLALVIYGLVLYFDLGVAFDLFKLQYEGERQIDNVSFMISQGALKLPVTLANAALGEIPQSTEVYHKQARVKVYKSLVTELINYFSEGTEHDKLKAQEKILDKPLNEITLKELKGVVQQITESLVEYEYYTIANNIKINANVLKTATQQLNGLAGDCLYDIEASAPSVTRVKRFSYPEISFNVSLDDAKTALLKFK